MTHASKISAEDLAQTRAKAILKNGLYTLVLAQTCATTRGGVVVTKSRYSDQRLEAHFFRPTQINRCYATKTIQSAHQALTALDQVAKDIADKKAAKARAHDLTIGDIMVDYMCYTSARATFYQVVGIPHPKKIAAVRISQTFTSGDWMSGQVVPIIPDTVADANTPDAEIFAMSMESGEASCKLNGIRNLSKWKGKPINVYCD